MIPHAPGRFAGWILLALCLPARAQDAEEKVRDIEYDADYAPAVRACEAAEKEAKDDAAAALKRLEEEVLPRLPRHFEMRLIVTYSRGINRGLERERHDFYPYRAAGRCALEAGLPEKAVEYLKKSPTSVMLLARAEKALEEKKSATAPPPLQKPRLDLAPFLSRGDFTGALKVLEAERARLGDDYAPRVEEVRREAAGHVSRQTAGLATALARIDEDDFFKEHLDPCLASCRQVPADLETRELQWARKLGEWFKKRDPDGFDRLAVEAAKLDEKYHIVSRHAQEHHLREIEDLVSRAQLAHKAQRPDLLTRLDAAERAFQVLAAAREFKDLRDELAGLKARLPVDAEALERARSSPGTVQDIRVMADQLERLWTSETRDRLSVGDRTDLALYLGIYRSMKLFLDGNAISDVAGDLRVTEVFGLKAVTLPPGLSPKVTRVYELVRQAR
jgi:hypothetical protein